MMLVWQIAASNQIVFLSCFIKKRNVFPPFLGFFGEHLQCPLGLLYFSVFVLFFRLSAFTPRSSLKLLPGCRLTKEPPSAGLKDGVARVSRGDWWIKNQSNWNGAWRWRARRETVNNLALLKMDLEFTVVIAFLPFLLPCLYIFFCNMSRSVNMSPTLTMCEILFQNKKEKVSKVLGNVATIVHCSLSLSKLKY